MVSPSHAKMGIKIKADNCTTRFSLDWIFNKFESINQEQLHSVFGFRAQQSTKTKKTATGKPLEEKPMVGDSRARFLLSDAF